MTELSPAAIAVDDALAACIQLQGEIIRARHLAAAALRAAADQVIPETTTPWNSTIIPMISTADVREQILAIADELEAQ